MAKQQVTMKIKNAPSENNFTLLFARGLDAIQFWALRYQLLITPKVLFNVGVIQCSRG